MKVAGVVGHKGNGKTHLLVRLIAAFNEMGVTVSSIKHTHHHSVELDTPGKDSHRHRIAGAQEVIVASDTGWTRIASRSQPATLEELLGELRPIDLVLIEGYKQIAALPRIEVWRGLGATAPLAAHEHSIAAVAAPYDLSLPPLHCPRLSLDDTDNVAQFLLRAARPVTTLFPTLLTREPTDVRITS